MNDLAPIKTRVDAAVARHKAACAQAATQRARLREAKTQAKHARMSHAIAMGVAQQIQTSAHRQIADVVTRSLAAVFDEPYEFKIDFEQKRGRTEARLIFERDGEAIDPMDASGGGVVDVAAFALRLACLMLSRPPKRKILFLDEPFRFVARDYSVRVRELLETLAREMECQFIIVTHQEELKAGTVVSL